MSWWIAKDACGFRRATACFEARAPRIDFEQDSASRHRARRDLPHDGDGCAAGRSGWPERAGLARLSQGTWTRFTNRDGLKSDVVAHVAEDSDGSIWIGYSRRVRFDALELSGRHGSNWSTSTRPTACGRIRSCSWDSTRGDGCGRDRTMASMCSTTRAGVTTDDPTA